MDKNFLLRLNKALKQIKTKLLLNKDIRTLLYYDNIDSDTPAPSVEQVKGHVFLQPVINVDVQEPFNKKNYITITMPEGERTQNAVEYVVRIIVMCDKSSWLVYDEDIRPLVIGQAVVNELDGFQTALAQELVFTNVVETVTSEDVVGYSLLFAVKDGISDIDEKD